MDERLESKWINYNYVFSQISEHGRLISEIAEEFNMSLEHFKEKLKAGFPPKLYFTALKLNKRNEKRRKTLTKEQKSSVSMGEKKKLEKIEKKEPTISEVQKLEQKKKALENSLSETESKLANFSTDLENQKKALSEKQEAFNKAKCDLDAAKAKYESAQTKVNSYSSQRDFLKGKISEVVSQISEIKNRAVYLVAPGFNGKVPEYGTFFSTVPVNGLANLKIIAASPEYEIKPELDNMLDSGYDSFSEYSEGLNFIMLCAEFTCCDKEYKVLVSDERIEKLLHSHIY